MQYHSTNGADFLTKDVYIEGNEVILQVWDTAGGEKFYSMRASFYRYAKCAILVFDLTDPKSFKAIDSWRKEFLNELNPKDPDTFPFVLIGNKCNKISERKVQQKSIEQYCKSKLNMPYFETS